MASGVESATNEYHGAQSVAEVLAVMAARDRHPGYDEGLHAEIVLRASLSARDRRWDLMPVAHVVPDRRTVRKPYSPGGDLPPTRPRR
jgi:hypothetical protein